MRAAKAPIGSGTAYGGFARKRPAVPEHGARARISFGLLHFWLLFFGLFFLGYLGGIYAGRDGSDYGSTLAQYYMDGQNYTSLLQVFSGLFAGAFLQITLVFVCGFSAWAGLFLALFFAARGILMGICASSIFVAGGARSLIIHWLLTCLPDLSTLFLSLWLAGNAAYLGGELFRCIFVGGNRNGLLRPTKALMLRYLFTVFCSLVLCGIGAAGSIVFAGVLL